MKLKNNETFGLMPESILDDMCVVCICVSILGCLIFFGYGCLPDHAKFVYTSWDLIFEVTAILALSIFCGMFIGVIATVLIGIICNIFLYTRRAVLAVVNYNVAK